MSHVKGTYVLQIVVDERITITVGALGSIAFDPGSYAYVGSAFGPGGLVRVERHREVSSGKRETATGTSTTSPDIRRQRWFRS